MLFAPEIAQVLRQQLTAAHPAAVVVQIVMHKVGVFGIHARVFGVLVFGTVARVVLVKGIVVVDQRVRRPREEIQQQLFDFRIEHPFHFRRVVEIGAFGFQMRQRQAQRT